MYPLEVQGLAQDQFRIIGEKITYRIAQRPVSPRDAARLLHVRADGLADETVRDLPGLLRVRRQLLDLEDERLQIMDDCGVDMHLLSVAPQTWLYGQEAAVGVAASAIQNDEIARHVKEHPDRFSGIATLPMVTSRVAWRKMSLATVR